MKQEIDLSYRPTEYYSPIGLRRHLINQLDDSADKKLLNSLIEKGEFGKLDELIGDTGMPNEVKEGLRRMHISYSASFYLPDLEADEVEVARIELATLHPDKTILYAKKLSNSYIYRVVDEYEGDTLKSNNIMDSNSPLTLGEMADFFFSAWPFFEVLERNYSSEKEFEELLSFFVAHSYYYMNFNELCVERVLAHFGQM